MVALNRPGLDTGSPPRIWGQDPHTVRSAPPVEIAGRQTSFDRQAKDAQAEVNSELKGLYRNGRTPNQSELDRFLGGGVKHFNRYAYVGNDPVNFVDVTGENRARRGIGRPPPIGHNGGPSIFGTVAPDYRRPGRVEKRLLTQGGADNFREQTQNENRHAEVIGLGNFQNVSRMGEGNPLSGQVGRIQSGVSLARYDGYRAGAFEFVGRAGTDAQSIFNAIVPSGRASNTNFETGPGQTASFDLGGGTSAVVNLRNRSSGETGIDIHLTTQQPGSSIKTLTRIKIHFEIGS